MTDSREKLLKLLKEKAYEKRDVVLASGKNSDFYIDVKRVSLMAEGSVLIGRGLYEMTRRFFPEAKAVGGLTLGADPLATAVAYTSHVEGHPLDAFIVRKELKSHGTGKLVEGCHLLSKGAPVVILEDVVTSGTSSLEAVNKVKAHGFHVVGILAVVDREEGGSDLLIEAGYLLQSLYKKSDFNI